ncbi:MAG: alpha/beta hydrolase domain-containing protein [Acidimicrobiales bacterium]
MPLGVHRAQPPTDGRADLMGSTTAFHPETARRLYGTREEYVKRFAAAVDHLVETAVVLPEDAGSVGDPLVVAVWG